MDVSKLGTRENAEKGARLYIKNPVTNKDLTIFMEVLGTDSKKYMNRMNETAVETVNKDKKDKAEIEDLEDIQETQIETLAMMVVGWGDHADVKGKDPKKGKVKDTWTWEDKELECTEKNILKVFKECPWMKEQVTKFMGERSNFLAL